MPTKTSTVKRGRLVRVTKPSSKRKTTKKFETKKDMVPIEGSNACLYYSVEPPNFVECPWMDFVLHRWEKVRNINIVLATGPRGSGKTLLIEVLAARLEKPLVKVECDHELTAQDLLGCSRVKAASDYWLDGPILLAAKHNAILYLSEFNALSPGAQLKLNGLGDRDDGSIFVQYTGERVTWKNPMIYLDANEGYAGTRTIQEALRDRCATVTAKYLDKEHEVSLIKERTGAPLDAVKRAVTTANAIRAASEGKSSDTVLPLEFHMSPRRLLEWGWRVKAGQTSATAWKEAVIDSVGSGPEVSPLKDVLIEISKAGRMM